MNEMVHLIFPLRWNLCVDLVFSYTRFQCFLSDMSDLWPSGPPFRPRLSRILKNAILGDPSLPPFDSSIHGLPTRLSPDN